LRVKNLGASWYILSSEAKPNRGRITSGAGSRLRS